MNLLVSSNIAPRSLEEVHGTIPVPPASRWRRFLAFSGPAFMVSVGYMDPGNWGTDLEAGSKFGYRLLWVLLLSNLMAVLLQTLATRLGVVTGQDLAQACRSTYPRRATFLLWVLCEIAIAACDLAEVIGTIIALKLLFGIPYLWGLVVAACDTFLLLAFQRRGMRPLEMVTLLLIGVIAGSFIFEIVLARPDWADVVRGLVPGLATENSEAFRDSLYVAIGMLGATVMPHNLYLHSALVQTRAFAPTPEGKRQALRFNFLDSMLALNGAFFVNAAILVLAVTTFHTRGTEVETLQDAHRLLGQTWGTALASILFAVALLASGQSSTLTGTLAGQVVMEGFVHLRIRPWLRRLITRSLALLPALVMIGLTGQGGDEVDHQLLHLLVLSQVILSMQLPFAIVPLVQFTADRNRMGAFASGLTLKVLAAVCAVIVVGLNVVLLALQTGKWADDLEAAGWSAAWVYGSMGPLALGLLGFLGWVLAYPWRTRREEAAPVTVADQLPGVRYHRIGVAVELEGRDDAVLAQAAALARTHAAELVAIHVVEGPAAAVYGSAAADLESRRDRERIAELTEHLTREGLAVRGVLGFGTPTDQLVRVVEREGIDLLVLGSHGHRLLADLALGNTVAPLLHKLKIPVLVVPSRPGPA
jgi:manganese transport protein